MAKIAGKDSQPELAVRRMLHAAGYRYRLHFMKLPGRPDLVFPPRRKVVFVHGCFWHQHDSEHCRHRRRPKSNIGYWNPKLDRNVRRDEENIKQLQAAGWESTVVWECELGEPNIVYDALRAFLGPQRLK